VQAKILTSEKLNFSTKGKVPQPVVGLYKNGLIQKPERGRRVFRRGILGFANGEEGAEGRMRQCENGLKRLGESQKDNIVKGRRKM